MTVLGIQGTRKNNAELPLTRLESLLAQDKLIDFLADETGRSASALRRALDEGGLLDEHALQVASRHDSTLVDRLRPFAGLIRHDSFERLLVVLTGSVYVTTGSTRRSTGTHYTPPTLTEPIVLHTLEPLVYAGPAQGWLREQWKLKTPKDILNLKVCDMAMGSGAFLVQVCRYLADRLVEAWENEEKQHPGQLLITPDGQFSQGEPTERLLPVDVDERIAIARRVVADRCLYGVDINPMAVEMAKLSLWLITVDQHRPFTFLDHAFKCGDSLLGITALVQLENFSLRKQGVAQQAIATLNLWRHIAEAQNKRVELEAMPSDTPEQIKTKTALYAEAEEAVAKLNAAADVLMALELKGFKGRRYEAERELAAEQMMAYWNKGLPEMQDFARQSLGARRCLHWALAFPEIMANGGFHAFVGNPPFIGGQKITGAFGTDYRDYLVNHIAQGKKGSADFCAYFFLQAGILLQNNGTAGLLATNTIAQGDTREVGLDQLLSGKYVIPRAIPSAPWPGIAALEISHVWLFKGDWLGIYQLNQKIVSGITAFLTAPGRVSGKPYPLKVNENKSFQGSIVLGMGFVLTPEEATALLESNPKNRDCLFPYLNGEDLNSRPDQSPSRWVINFHDWPLNREGVGKWIEGDDKQRKEWLRCGIVPLDYPGSVAADYPELLTIIVEKVKPERILNKYSKTARSKWWLYERTRDELYANIAEKFNVLASCRVTKYISHSLVLCGSVFDVGLNVIVNFDSAMQTVLESSIYEVWVHQYASSLETRFRYTLNDCFETFPFSTDGIEDTEGYDFHTLRKSIMLKRALGLTDTYNIFNNPDCLDKDIANLRDSVVALDKAVATAYGWQDLHLSHGFYETKQGIRFTISDAARCEVLDRLLALNHQRHAEEQAAALPAKRSKKPKDSDNSLQIAMEF